MADVSEVIGSSEPVGLALEIAVRTTPRLLDAFNYADLDQAPDDAALFGAIEVGVTSRRF